MKQCCNEQTSTFCPVCGEMLTKNSKEGLVSFLQAKAKAQVGYLKRSEERLQKATKEKAWLYELRVETNKRKLAKWEAWVAIAKASPNT